MTLVPDAYRCGMIGARPGPKPRRPTPPSGRHLPPPEIMAALLRALAAGLVLHGVHSGPRWGLVACVQCHADRTVWAAPRDPVTHAKQVDRFVHQHSHA
jgi:hypothetical protein